MAMFGKKKKEQQPAAPVKTPAAQNDTTYFGKNLSITGKVSGQGNLIILGTFDGEFDLRGQLKVAQGANIKGNIKASDIDVNGNIEGIISASEKIHLDSTAKVKGRVSTPKISVLEGAVFDGEIEMSKQPVTPPKAQVPENKPSSSAFVPGEKK